MDQNQLENRAEMAHSARMGTPSCRMGQTEVGSALFKVPETHARPVNVADRRNDGRHPGHKARPSRYGRHTPRTGRLKALVAVGDVRLLHLSLGVGKPGKQIFGMYL